MNYVEVRNWGTIRVCGAASLVQDAKKIAARHAKSQLRWRETSEGWLRAQCGIYVYTISGPYYDPCEKE